MGKPGSTSQDKRMSRLRVSEEEAREFEAFLESMDTENVPPENNKQIPSLREMLRRTVFQPNPVQELAEALCRLKPLFEYSARPIFKGFVEQHFNDNERTQLQSFSGEVLKIVQDFGVTPSKFCDLFDEDNQSGLVKLLKDYPQLQQLCRDHLGLLQKVNQVWVNETYLTEELIAPVTQTISPVPTQEEYEAKANKTIADYERRANKRRRCEMFPEPDAKRVKEAEESKETVTFFNRQTKQCEAGVPEWALPFHRVRA